jgi:hypothetical protein
VGRAYPCFPFDHELELRPFIIFNIVLRRIFSTFYITHMVLARLEHDICLVNSIPITYHFVASFPFRPSADDFTLWPKKTQSIIYDGLKHRLVFLEIRSQNTQILAVILIIMRQMVRGHEMKRLTEPLALETSGNVILVSTAPLSFCTESGLPPRR